MTKIEWTDATWNPVVGCSIVSKGCEHCYAMGVAHRGMHPDHRGLTVLRDHGKGPRWTGEVRFLPDRLAEPLAWKRPRLVFVNSMSDLFHDGVSFEQIAEVFGVMAATPRHAYQLLTKRPERARAFFAWLHEQGEDLRAAIGEEPSSGSALPSACAMFVGKGRTPPLLAEDLLGREGWRAAMAARWPLPNVWLGVSVEDQATHDERVPLLLELPAAIRWVSYEPALGPVRFDERDLGCAGHLAATFGNPLINWIVVGGESGARARPFDIAWARSVIAQGRAAGVPMFVKQLGARPYASVSEDTRGKGGVGLALGNRKGGDPEEWPEDLRVREWPEVRS